MAEYNNERWITIDEAACRLGLSERDVENLATVTGVITIRPTTRGQLLAAFEVDALAPAVSETQIGENLRNLYLFNKKIVDANEDRKRVLEELNSATAELERRRDEKARFIGDRGGVETWLAVSRHILSMYRGMQHLNGSEAEAEMTALEHMLEVMSCEEIAAEMNVDVATFQRLSGKILSSMAKGNIRLAYENVTRLENENRKLAAENATLKAQLGKS